MAPNIRSAMGEPNSRSRGDRRIQAKQLER
ncbi:MAG: hypothetical protein CNCCGFBP_02319 [Fimbriimonadaceae bacterium]|nr:hypothetical protein [Fimbriimonadaceae bacterium]